MIKKIFYSILAIFALCISSSLNAECNLKVPNKEIPILLKIDSQEVVSKTCYPVLAYSFKDDSAKIPAEISTIYNKISESASDLSDILLNQKDAKKAAGLLAKLGDRSKLEMPCVIFFEDFAIIPFKSQASKLRPDLMFAALKKDNKGLWKWDLSLRTPAVLSIIESFQKSGIKDVSDLETLLGFTDISKDNNQDDKALKFYKFWQAKFYALDLPAYATIMTEKSKEVYTKQYLTMSKEAQAEALKDYITYHKNFYLIARLDELNVMLYTRIDKGKINSYDAAFLLKDGDTFKLANFGQDQGKFADYLISKIRKIATDEN